jgi:hypothetical protein
MPHMTLDPDIFDSLFHAAAFAAYVELAVASGGPPESDATKWLAYKIYEEWLAAKNACTISLAVLGEAVAE